MKASDHHDGRSVRAMTVAGFALTALSLLAAPALAQSSNEIVAVEPSSAAQGTTGLLVTFTAVASGALSPYACAWDLGGTAASGSVVTHAFPAGTHLVTLTVTDAAGFSTTSVEDLVVAGAGLIFADSFESGDASAWSGAVGGS